MTSRRVRRGWISALAVGLAGLVMATACAPGDDFSYVSNRDAGLYFRVPGQWTVFDLDGTEGRPDAVTPARPWTRGIDASPLPSEGNLTNPVPLAPTGLAEIQPVRIRQDEVNLSTLRALALEGEADPLTLVEEGDEAIEIVRLEDIALRDGFRGQRLVFNLQLEGDRFVTIDQTALLNNELTAIYRLLLRCESQCYENHRGAIDGVVDSWTIEPA